MLNLERVVGNDVFYLLSSPTRFFFARTKLIHNIELNYLSPKAAHWKIQVDASTGEIIKKQNLIKHATAEGSGTGVNGDKKSPLYLSNDNGQ